MNTTRKKEIDALELIDDTTERFNKVLDAIENADSFFEIELIYCVGFECDKEWHNDGYGDGNYDWIPDHRRPKIYDTEFSDEQKAILKKAIVDVLEDMIAPRD